MKVLFDTNVLLDVFLKREPFFNSSVQALAHAEKNNIEGWVCGTTITTIHYLLSKALKAETAKQHIRQLLKIFHVASVSRVVLEDALESNFNDFEDAVLYHSALHANVEVVLTRNQKDFTTGALPVYSPKEFLKAKYILQ